MVLFFQEERMVLDGYKGVVASLVSSHPGLELAVSVALGSKLFFHIVSTAFVATKILNLKNKLGISGEFNFIPMDKIMTRQFEYPKSNHAVPLFEHVSYPQELERAFKVSHFYTFFDRELWLCLKVLKEALLLFFFFLLEAWDHNKEMLQKELKVFAKKIASNRAR